VKRRRHRGSSRRTLYTNVTDPVRLSKQPEMVCSWFPVCTGIMPPIMGTGSNMMIRIGLVELATLLAGLNAARA